MNRINKIFLALTAGALVLGGLCASTLPHGVATPVRVAMADTSDVVLDEEELDTARDEESVAPAVADTGEYLPLAIRDTLAYQQRMAAVRDYQSRIHLLTRTYGDSIVLRWAADDYVSWQHLNTFGVDILRMENGNDLKYFWVDTLAHRLKPATLEQWRAKYPMSDSLAVMAMGYLYGEGGFTQDQSRHGMGEMGALLDVYDDQQFRFGMAVLVTEWRRDIAEHMAMRFVDRKVKKGHTYTYIVRPSEFDTTGHLQFRVGHVEDLKNQKYHPEPYEAVMGDSVIGVNKVRIWWEQTPRFSSFDIHRRAMGETRWTKVNDRPFLMMRDVKEQDLDNFIDDEVTPGTYEYRISGYDAFGDYVPAENIHVATMPDIDAPRSPILKQIVIDRRNDDDLSKDVFADFHFMKDTLESDFIGYKILYYQRSRETGKGEWTELTPTLIPVGDTLCTVEVTGLSSSQVTVAAYDTAQNVSYSMTHLIRISDVEAPLAPENFRYEVIDNAAGLVRLTWTPPSIDVDYYEVAFANDTTHEFMLRKIQGATLLRDTVYVDTLAVDVNQKYIYYKVRAVDFATNEGDYTAPLQVLRPSMVQPGVAHIDSAWVDQQKGIRMRWVCSNEQQVSHHVLMRRLADAKDAWTVIGVYNGDSLTAAGNLLDVTDVPEHNRDHRYEYAMETFSYAGISSGISLIYSVRFEGEIVFEWPIRLFGDYDAKNSETKIAWETDGNLPYKGEWYFCIFRKGPEDKRFKFLLSADPADRMFNDFLLGKGESAQYYIQIQYTDGRSTVPSNTITVTAPAE